MEPHRANRTPNLAIQGNRDHRFPEKQEGIAHEVKNSTFNCSYFSLIAFQTR